MQSSTENQALILAFDRAIVAGDIKNAVLMAKLAGFSAEQIAEYINQNLARFGLQSAVTSTEIQNIIAVNNPETEQFVNDVYQYTLNRAPTPEEAQCWNFGLDTTNDQDIVSRLSEAIDRYETNREIDPDKCSELDDTLQSVWASFDLGDNTLANEASKIEHIKLEMPTKSNTAELPGLNLSVGAFALPLLLAACGGGGGGSSGSADSSTGGFTIKELNQDFIASIDLRFDHPTDFTTDGLLVNSFANVKRSVDLAKQNGFTAIELDLNVPIDIRTGEILTIIDNPFNPDRSLPDDTWTVIRYAESIGLDTSIKLNIVNANNDEVITTGSVAPGFSTKVFFDSVTAYQTDIAKQAQASGVDQIVIGGMNFGFDTGYRSEWQSLVSSIRNVYSGELAYETYYQRDGIVPWDLVDNIALTFTPDLGTAKFSAADIVPLYLQNVDRSSWGTFNPYERISELSTRYQGKDLMIYGVAKSPLQDSLNEDIAVHEILYTNNQSQDLSTLDFNLQNTRYDGFFEFFGNYLDDKVSAVQFWQFAPWAEAEWIKNPQDNTGEAFNTYARGGYFLNYQPETLDAINDYLQQGWGHNTLDFPDSNDAQVMPMSLMMGPHLPNPNPWGDPALFIA